MPKSRFLSREEALSLLQLAGEYHRGERNLPPEILEKRKEVDAAMHRAQLFIIRIGAVDEGMVNDYVELRLELDNLYGMWAVANTPSVH